MDESNNIFPAFALGHLCFIIVSGPPLMYLFITVFGTPKWMLWMFDLDTDETEESEEAEEDKKDEKEEQNKEDEKQKTKDEVLVDGSAAPRCVICLANKVQTAIVDCGHSCLCFACATVLRTKTEPEQARCPKCRIPVTKIICIFLEN